jgi:hypothetical protein
MFRKKKPQIRIFLGVKEINNHGRATIVVIIKVSNTSTW